MTKLERKLKKLNYKLMSGFVNFKIYFKKAENGLLYFKTDSDVYKIEGMCVIPETNEKAKAVLKKDYSILIEYEYDPDFEDIGICNQVE